jgi:hypothetical protein
MSDDDLLTYATRHERAPVTENVADVMPLAALWAGTGRAHTGLIFTSPRRFNRATVAYPGNLVLALREFLTDPPITGASWIWPIAPDRPLRDHQHAPRRDRRGRHRRV